MRESDAVVFIWCPSCRYVLQNLNRSTVLNHLRDEKEEDEASSDTSRWYQSYMANSAVDAFIRGPALQKTDESAYMQVRNMLTRDWGVRIFDNCTDEQVHVTASPLVCHACILHGCSTQVQAYTFGVFESPPPSLPLSLPPDRFGA